MQNGQPPPEFEPEFADDAFSGGDVEAVLAALQAEIRLAPRMAWNLISISVRCTC